MAQPLIDDGACRRLVGMTVPSVPLVATSGRYVDLSKLPGRVVVYCYPKTGRPDIDPPSGWERIPGAIGCTAQSCTFRDRHPVFQVLGCPLFGLSTQTTEYQLEAAERLHLPFELLSDKDLVFSSQLQLPTFRVNGETFLKRVTIIANSGRIEKVFYPINQPDKNAEEVIGWLSVNPQ